MNKFAMIPALVALAMSGAAFAGDTASAPNAQQYFVNIEDGATVTSPVKIIFGLSGMGVAPAGSANELTGHHHILLDRPPFGAGPDGKAEGDANIIADDNNIHYGKGQTEATLTLKPGKHTLQLLLGDKNHTPHNPPIHSKVITITVK